MQDARILEPDTVLEYDVCVVGSGPASQAVVRPLLARGLKICVLESGGEKADPAKTRLTEGEVEGHCLMRLQEVVRRQFGGTVPAWNTRVREETGARLLSLDPIDFEKREWVSHSGWPLNQAELAGYYRQAYALLGLQADAEATEFWRRGPDWPAFAEGLGVRIYQVVPQGQMQESLKALNGPEITTWLNATVVGLQARQGQLEALRVATSTERRFTVKSRFFVLAAGGIENTRLLLASRVAHSPALGRYLNEHPVFRSGFLFPRSSRLFEQSKLFDLRHTPVGWTIAKLTLPEKVVREHRLLNCATALFPRGGSIYNNRVRWLFPRGRNYFTAPSVEAYMEMVRAVERGRPPRSLWPYIRRFIEGGLLDLIYFKLKHTPHYHFGSGEWSLVEGGWSELPQQRKGRFRFFELATLAEQFPNPDNRITLSDEKDAYGVPRPHWNLRYTVDDLENVLRYQQLLKAALEDSGLGRVKLLTDGSAPDMAATATHHPMGGTRMAEDPTRGVVDRNCKVHGLDNLFIAGCSVFPTGGYANPTLTIMALGLRLGEHLRDRVRNF